MTRPWRIPSGAVRDAGPYAKRNRWSPPSTPTGAAAGTMAFGRGVAPVATGAWDDRAFRPLRRATGALPLDPAILGCPPFVGKSGRRGILRQAKVWLCSHTGCMARSHTAGMAEKARRAPADTRTVGGPHKKKNRVKLLTFLWRRRLLIFGQKGEGQDYFEQVAGPPTAPFCVLQLRQTPGNGQS